MLVYWAQGHFAGPLPVFRNGALTCVTVHVLVAHWLAAVVQWRLQSWHIGIFGATRPQASRLLATLRGCLRQPNEGTARRGIYERVLPLLCGWQLLRYWCGLTGWVPDPALLRADDVDFQMLPPDSVPAACKTLGSLRGSRPGFTDDVLLHGYILLRPPFFRGSFVMLRLQLSYSEADGDSHWLMALIARRKLNRK